LLPVQVAAHLPHFSAGKTASGTDKKNVNFVLFLFPKNCYYPLIRFPRGKWSMTKVLPKTHRRHPAYAGTLTFSDESVHAEDVDQLWAVYKNNPTDQLRNRLVERYISIVYHRAERVWSRLPEGIELDDLIQVGTIGLMNAISSFDPSRGIRFEAFCLPRIQGAMQDYLRDTDWAPRAVRSKSTKLRDAEKTLEQQHGRKPTDQELADALGISGKELHQNYAEIQHINVTSLDKTFSDREGSKDMREIDMVPDRRSEDPTEQIAKVDLLRTFTKGLNKTERMIIIMYYYEELTMKEIGAALDISESRVSQMHSSIVERMKKMYGNVA
jgi:RNA polymerase sigma factor for flagellar operon FliA